MPRMTTPSVTSADTSTRTEVPPPVPEATPTRVIARAPVAERLERLFEETRRPDGQLWTMTYLADELKARGVDTSRQYLGALMTGERGEPRISLVEAIADVFELPVSYFTGDYLGRVSSDLLPLLVALRDPHVAALLHRTDLQQVAGALAATTVDVPGLVADPNVQGLLERPDVHQVAEDLINEELLSWVGSRPLADVLATLRSPVVQSAVEETLAAVAKYGTRLRG